MSKIDFDNYSNNYNEVLAKSLGPFVESNTDFFDSYKINCLEAFFSVKSQYRFLDFGCGIGKLSRLLADKFHESKVDGYDVSAKSLLVAQKQNESISNLSFSNSLDAKINYDVILAANVFHHIKHTEHQSTLQYLKNLLKPTGTIVVFEHNPLNLLTRYVVKRCPFDADAELIQRQQFMNQAIDCGLHVKVSRYVLMFPWKHRFFRRIENIFPQVPLGTQYMLLLTNPT